MERSAHFGYMLLGLALFTCVGAQAVIQGEPGEKESTAVTTITLNIEPSIQISNVSDIELDVTDRNQDIRHEERVCVRGNIGSRYSVIADGKDGSAQPFSLNTNSGDTIAFDVYFRGDLSDPVGDQLNPGERSPFYDMQSSAQECGGDDTASFIVVFKSEDLLPAEPGVYSGYLTLTVAAE